MMSCKIVVFIIALLTINLQLYGKQNDGSLYLSCEADNDLYNALQSNSVKCFRFSNPDDAANSAPSGAGVLILADNYPENLTDINQSIFKTAVEKRLRLYVEFPSQLPGMNIGAVDHDRLARAVITSDAFGENLKPMRILTINGCRFLTVKADNLHMVFTKVAGFDTAVYGLKDTVSHPILFEHPKGNLLVATTKLSNFVKGRYGPKEAWQEVWKMVLNWVTNNSDFKTLEWTETVTPTYDRDDVLPDDAMRTAAIRGVQWFYKGNFLIHPSWKHIWQENEGGGTDPWGPPMDLSLPDGDGTLGILEGHASRLNWDGSQQYRYWIRNDCQGESSLAFGLYGVFEDNDQSRKVAANLLDYIYFISDMRKGERNDPASPSYGLIGWANTHPHIYYGDDNARSLLGGIGVASLLNEDRWDMHMLEAILANFRTTGRFGFRTGCLVDADIQKKGWQKFWNGTAVNPHPHFESWIWSMYLWLYDKTGYKPLLEKTRTGIEMTMDAYPNKWNWTNGLQQERARMVLPLAWLVRVEDTPRHRIWLRQIVEDVLKNQDSCGGIREELGRAGAGMFGASVSNDSYGSTEAPIIQENGDMAADMLYTSNFFFIGLHEAAYATGDRYYKKAADRLAEFLVRIQAKSDAHPDLDGVWFRGFDFGRWQYWGSNADAGWGVWGSLTGWTQSWIVSTLAMRQQNTSLWDITKNSKIAEHFEECRQRMMPDDQLVLTSPYSVMHNAVGKTVTVKHKPASHYSGESGIQSLVDGRVNKESDLSFSSAEWMGFHGVDLEAVIDMGKVINVNQLSASFLQELTQGIILPKKVEFMISDNASDYRSVGIVDIEADSSKADKIKRAVSVYDLDENVRYIKVIAQNIGIIPAGFPGGGLKAWLFVDEIMVNPPAEISIIPQPREIKVSKGEFLLTSDTVIVTGQDVKSIGQYLSKVLAPATGYELKVKSSSDDKQICLIIDENLSRLGDEGYELNVQEERVVARAYKAAGLFYACQTLRQLLPPEIMKTEKITSIEWEVPCVNIEDTPRFPWRGQLMDSSRHFFSTDVIKRQIDLLALHKMNRFHWHLTDDHGWRIEIKKYPRLTEVGAWRKEMGFGASGEDNIKPYGGFYTQDELREIVRYAKERFITIVPEIEMPGHSLGLMTSYPELSCTGGPFEVWTSIPGICHDSLCAGNDKTFEVLESILDEVIDIFPSQYIHIGGDECSKTRWKECVKCQDRIKAEHLNDEVELQSYFIRRIGKYLQSKKRRIIGWHEILHGELASGAVVQSWHGPENAVRAANQGHNVIMSQHNFCYLDYNYKSISLSKAYSYEPVPNDLALYLRDKIIGLECNMWTEWVPDRDQLDYQVFPRLCAYSEVGWAQKARRDFQDFMDRMSIHYKRLQNLGVKYCENPN